VVNNQHEIYSDPSPGVRMIETPGLLTVMNREYAISSDSAFVVFKTRSDSFTTGELYVVSIDGGQPTRINSDLPDGGEINFFQVAGGLNTVVYRADEVQDNVHEIFAARFGFNQVNTWNYSPV
jgi:hypothetical protein